MSRTSYLASRLAAFAASLLFATLSLAASVGPAVQSFPVA